jgi:hypothetical protein
MMISNWFRMRFGRLAISSPQCIRMESVLSEPKAEPKQPLPTVPLSSLGILVSPLGLFGLGKLRQ